MKQVEDQFVTIKRAEDKIHRDLWLKDLYTGEVIAALAGIRLDVIDRLEYYTQLSDSKDQITRALITEARTINNVIKYMKTGEYK